MKNAMRILMNVKLPHEPFNNFVKDGTAAAKLGKLLDATQPEAAYFTEQNGQRSGMLFVDLPEASKIPALVEPWFLTFQADVEIRIVMTAEDLKRSALDEIGKKWG